MFIALISVKKLNEKVLRHRIGHKIVNAAVILAIAGGGGALETILKITPIGKYIEKILASLCLCIFLPFLIVGVLKSTQGSSIIAMITTPAIIAPLLPSLELGGPRGKVLTALTIGARVMIASHTNDSYFWTASRFTYMDVPSAYKAYTTAISVLGLVSMAIIAIMTAIIL